MMCLRYISRFTIKHIEYNKVAKFSSNISNITEAQYNDLADKSLESLVDCLETETVEKQLSKGSLLETSLSVSKLLSLHTIIT